MVVASVSAPFGRRRQRGRDAETAEAADVRPRGGGRLGPDAPPSSELYTAGGEPADVPLQAIPSSFELTSASCAALGSPLACAAPGWQAEVPTRDQVPPMGPE